MLTTLFHSGDNVWKKSNSDTFFARFHGAEVCDLVVRYILSKLGNVLSNYGLYRDGGLSVIDLAKPKIYGKN